MKFFLDTEFIDDGKTIEPISIGIIAETGAAFYVELDFDEEKARRIPFLVEHVLPHLKAPVGDARVHRLDKFDAADRLQYFVHKNTDAMGVEFWAYYASYDWVVVSQLFGPMVDLPKTFPHLCFDLQQLWCTLGRPPVKPPQPEDQHNALADARWNKEFYETMKPYDDAIVRGVIR